MKKLFGALIGIGGCFAMLSAAEILFQQPMDENAIRKVDKFKTASLVEADGVKCMHLKAGGFHLPVNLADWAGRKIKVTYVVKYKGIVPDPKKPGSSGMRGTLMIKCSNGKTLYPGKAPLSGDCDQWTQYSYTASVPENAVEGKFLLSIPSGEIWFKSLTVEAMD